MIKVGKRVSDGLTVSFAGWEALLDLDAASSTSGEPVYDVFGAVAAVFVARLRDAYRDARADYRGFDGSLDLLLQKVGRSATDEDFLLAEPMEGNGVSEASRADLIEAREASSMDIYRGDMPTLVSATPLLPAFTPPRAYPLGSEPRRDALGLLVGVPLDISPVGRNSD